MKKMIMGLTLTMFAISQFGCAAGEEEALSSTSLIEVSGAFSTTVSGAGFSTSAIEDYSVFCVSFETVPTANSGAISAAGDFSLEMPADTPFGCFVVTAAGQQVATIVKDSSDDSSFASGDTDSFAMSGSLDMGTGLTLDLESGKVAVPEAQFTQESSANSGLDLADIHGQGYTMSCISSGNDSNDTVCAQFIQESPNVYFRVLLGTENGENVQGLGVWASESAFTGCGSVDLDQAPTGVTFTQGQVGSFTEDATACALRDQETTWTTETINDYYTVNKLLPTGGGYTLRDEAEVYEWTEGDVTCASYHALSVTFTQGSGSTLVGKFSVQDKVEGGAVCEYDGYMAIDNTFLVEFTPSN
jgi:hypothetical protein